MKTRDFCLIFDTIFKLHDEVFVCSLQVLVKMPELPVEMLWLYYIGDNA